MIASKQIYATHYFDASLGLTVLVRRGEGPGYYLMYLNRSRADALKGGFSGLRRAVVEGRTVDGMKKNLFLTKQKLEAGYQSP